MRVLVCGGRSYADRTTLWADLDELLAAEPLLVIIVGYDPDDPRYQGADELAYKWARHRGVPVMPFPAQWHRFGRSAGPRRNGRMLSDAKPHAVKAFPGDVGTGNMIDQAHRAGLPVQRVGW